MEVPNPFKRNKTDEKEEDKNHEEKEEEPKIVISKNRNIQTISKSFYYNSIKYLTITLWSTTFFQIYFSLENFWIFKNLFRINEKDGLCVFVLALELF